jgi:hypothetical protein
MRLGNRLRRVEKAVQKRVAQESTDPDPGIIVSAAERVRILRTVRTHVGARMGERIEDPFPELDGEEYMVAFWRWYLRNGWRSWPQWAQDPTERVICSTSVEMRVRCMRGLYAHFSVSDPFPRLQGQAYLDASRRLRTERP